MKKNKGQGIKRPEGPCRRCTDRTAGCHATCERYHEFREELMEFSRTVYEARKPYLIAKSRPWMMKDSEAQKEYRKEKQAEYKKEAERDRKG